MTEKGTIKDDCIITKVTEDEFYVVINAGCKVTDLQHFNKIKDAEFKGKDVNI
jgi:glycine cleavage system aminomethyltransferase T